MPPAVGDQQPLVLRALNVLLRAGLVSIGLFLASATSKIAYDDYSMTSSLVSMDRDRCVSIEKSYPRSESRHPFESCLAGVSAREADYRQVAIAHAVVVFLALLALPGIMTIVIATMLRRSRNAV